MVDPDILVKGLSSIASILSITSSVKKMMQDRGLKGPDAVELYKETATSEERSLLAQPSVLSSVLAATVISPKLLDQYAKEAYECEDRHIADRAAAQSQSAKIKADTNAAHCMCSVLRSLKGHNNDMLPGEEFESWWISYGCPN